MQPLISAFDEIIFHFDGNNNDPDDIAALPMAAAIAKSADLQDKTTFFYGNNLSEPNNSNMVRAMRESGAFAEKLGIDAHSYQDGIDATTAKVVEILNSGKKVLAIEGGPMEAIYRALEQVSPANRNNLTLLSHSSWNENRDVGSRPGGGKPRTWSDIRSDFPQVTQIDIADQNSGNNNNRGFNNSGWSWLDNTSNPVLQEAREKMNNAGSSKANDPSDAGMLFYAITGQETADADDARAFFDQNPPSFGNQPTPPAPTPTPPTPIPPTPTPTDPIYLGQNGSVILEAESAKQQGNWKFVTRQGRQAVLYDGPNSFGKAKPEQTLSYSFETDQSGKFSIALYSLRDPSVMAEVRNDLGNDAFIAIENAQTGELIQASTKLFTYFGSANNEYRWGTTFDKNHKKSPAEVSLQANTTYRLLVTGRSDGYAIDRITLNKGGFLEDANTPASPIKGGKNPTPPAPTPQPPTPPTPTPIPTPTPNPSDADIIFSLVNSETDQVVEGYEDLSSSSTIDLKGLNLKNYSILAQVKGAQANAVESIRFMSEAQTQIESFEPYALYGDNKGDYKGVAASEGKYTLKATAYSQNGAKGKAIAQANLNYTIVDTTNAPKPTPTPPTPTPTPPTPPTPTPTPPPSIPMPEAGLITFALVNAETNKVVKTFNDLGTKHTFNPKTLGLKQYNLVAQINPNNAKANTVESVVFKGTAGNRTENIAPYASFGDIEGDYFGRAARARDYMMTATAYTKDGGKGNTLGTATLNYTILSESLGASASTSTIDNPLIGSGQTSTGTDPIMAAVGTATI